MSTSFFNSKQFFQSGHLEKVTEKGIFPFSSHLSDRKKKSQSDFLSLLDSVYSDQWKITNWKFDVSIIIFNSEQFVNSSWITFQLWLITCIHSFMDLQSYMNVVGTEYQILSWDSLFKHIWANLHNKINLKSSKLIEKNG